MRVLIVSHTYTAPINRAKLSALARRVTLTALIPARWRDALFTLRVDRASATNYTLHALPVYFDGHILRYIYPFRALAHLIAHTQPDVIYVEEEPASLALAQCALLKARAKLICFTWENIARRVGAPGVERFNLSRCDGIIAGNTDAAQVVRAKNFTKPLVVTPQLGVDPELFQPRARDTDARAFVVGYIGRLVAEKGVWTLLAAIADLPTAQLALVGDGALRGEIEHWVATRQLETRVRVVPAMPHEEIARVLNTLDVLVLPSQTTATWKEQFGHVLIEAMAAGVPVIGSDSGAIPEVIGEVGIIFPEGDARALRDAIHTLQNDVARRAQLAQHGRARVLAHYTHERIAAANVEFFERVLAA
ncbi:MAG: glycosyltransferase [Anaerolineae bacterium]|nr:glycosyltransferase [Anaerolineae bacterium]